MGLYGRVVSIGARSVGQPSFVVNIRVKNDDANYVAVLGASAEMYLTIGEYAGINDSAFFIGLGSVDPSHWEETPRTSGA